MYRFSQNGEAWILRMIPEASIDFAEKELLVKSLFQIDKDLSLFSHGESFMIVDRNIGAIIYKVEKIPSPILTVCNIIAKENWFLQIN